MKIAQMLIRKYGRKFSQTAVYAASISARDISNDWESESTIYTFADGSKLVWTNNELKAQ